MKIILLGAPGSGKGTQSVHLSKKYNVPHISTGDIFRDMINEGSELGKKIKEIIDGGNLCPDELTVEIVKDRLSKSDCENGYVLDGFPRTVKQAKDLDKICSYNAVVYLHIDLDKIERRLTGRRVCKGCKKSFHLDLLKDLSVCPECGEELIIRDDDNVESVKERLNVYKGNSEPLIDYYKNKGKLIAIDGGRSVEDVFKSIVKGLEGNDND